MKIKIYSYYANYIQWEFEFFKKIFSTFGLRDRKNQKIEERISKD